MIEITDSKYILIDKDGSMYYIKNDKELVDKVINHINDESIQIIKIEKHVLLGRKDLEKIAKLVRAVAKLNESKISKDDFKYLITQFIKIIADL